MLVGGKIINPKKLLLIVIGISLIGIFYALLMYIISVSDIKEQSSPVSETQKLSTQKSDNQTLISKLLANTNIKSGKSLLSQLLEPFSEQTIEPVSTPVELYYTIEKGQTDSKANFYINTVTTPVQGVQMEISYPIDISVSLIESSLRFPDMIVANINNQTKTFKVMTSVGVLGEAVIGEYPIFSIVFSGDNPSFTIKKEETIVATQGQSIPFIITKTGQ